MSADSIDKADYNALCKTSVCNYLIFPDLKFSLLG